MEPYKEESPQPSIASEYHWESFVKHQNQSILILYLGSLTYTHNFRAELNIFYLKIPMHNSTLMEVPNCINNRTDNIPGLLLSINFLLHDFLIQLTPCQIFQNQINVLFVSVKVIKLYNIRVADVFHDVDFTLKENLLFFVHFLPYLIT